MLFAKTGLIKKARVWNIYWYIRTTSRARLQPEDEHKYFWLDTITNTCNRCRILMA